MNDGTQAITGSVTTLYVDAMAGNAAATERLLERLLPEIKQAARRRMRQTGCSTMSSTGLANATLLTFHQNVHDGKKTDARNRDDLLGYAVSILKLKILERLRRESALKRGGGRVHAISNLSLEDIDDFQRKIVHHEPGSVRNVVQELLECLPGNLESIAILKIAGALNREIANQLGVSLSTVERKLRLIRSTWRNFVDDPR